MSSRQKLLDVRIIGSPQYLIRPFKYDLSIAQHQKAGVGDAQSVRFLMKHRVTGQVFGTADALSEFLLVPVLTGRPR